MNEGGRAWRQAATPTPTAPFVSASEVIPFSHSDALTHEVDALPCLPHPPPSSHLWCVLSIPGNLYTKRKEAVRACY